MAKQAKKSTPKKQSPETTQQQEPVHLAILDDHWLDPVKDDIIARYNRFQAKFKELESYYPTFVDFAGQYKYLGLNYSEEDKGWYLREWAPNAKEIFLFGDFNNWDRYKNPLVKK